jgi:hypothetical protein
VLSAPPFAHCATDCDPREDHAVKSAGVDEFVRHQGPGFAGKASRAQEWPSRRVAAAADEIQHAVGMAGLMPLGGAVRGVGLPGDQEHGGPWRLFRAWRLALALVSHEAPRGIDRDRQRLGLVHEWLWRPFKEEKRIAHRPDSNDARPCAYDRTQDKDAQRKKSQSAE